MIALDTNVIARYVVRDDPRQTAAATRLIESECSAEAPGVVTLVVLCELVWVLDRGYGYGRADIALVLRRILAAEELRAERSDLAWRALNEYEAGKADFADFVVGLSGKEEKAAATYTLDRRAASSDMFRLVKA